MRLEPIPGGQFVQPPSIRSPTTNDKSRKTGGNACVHGAIGYAELFATLFATGGWLGAEAQDDQSLAYYRQAKINWRQAEWQSLIIGLNKHPFTEFCCR